MIGIRKCRMMKVLVPLNNFKSFTLFIPKNKLQFIHHVKHGKVYPVYIADKEFERRKDPNKLTPLISLFSIFNFYLMFAGLNFLPLSNLYQSIHNQQLIFYGSFIFNGVIIKRYFNKSLEYKNRLHKMYLLPDGANIIILNFDGSEHNIAIDEIYQSKIDNKFEQRSKAYPLFVNNNNSTRVSFSHNNGKEIFITGKTLYCDWEILKNVINRNDIETKTVQFQENEEVMKWYDEDELRSVISFVKAKNSVIYKKINLQREISNLRMKRQSKRRKIESDSKLKFLI